MKFVFVDEIECSGKNAQFFGLGAVIINSNSYHKFKEHFESCFNKLRWNKDIEFKGKYLFSKKGDNTVSVEKRIDFVKDLVIGFNASKNARLNCLFCRSYTGTDEAAYLGLLEKIVNKIKRDGSGHKSVVGYFIDANNKIDKKKIIEIVDSKKLKGVSIFERPFFVDSDNYVPGVIAVDVFCYLKSWIELNPSEKGQLQLFSSLSDMDSRKLVTIKEIISLIKNIKDVK